MKLVKVTWNDAHASVATLYEVHEIPHQATVVQTYGLLLRQDDSGVSLANELCSGETYRGVTFIPAGMIVKVEELKLTKPRKPKTVPLPDASPQQDTLPQ